MVPFLEVVKNWGDFAGSGGRGGSIVPGARFDPASRPAWAMPHEGLEAYAGGNAYNEAEPGYGSPWQQAREVQGQMRRRREHAMMEAARLIKRTFEGDELARIYFKRAMHGGFREAMGIGDFPNLFGDVIDRSVLANYLETPYTWNLICRQATLSDFRPKKIFRVDGGTGLLGDLDSSQVGGLKPLEMGGNYPEDSLSVPSPYMYSLFKRGKRMPFFWETFINDDLDALKDTPARFGRGARREEEYFVTSLFANNLTFFSNAAGHKNIVNAANVGDGGTNNPAFDIHALQRAIIVMMQQTDTTGQPISVEAMTLVVPPSLKTIAMNVLNTDYVWMADQGGTIITPNNNSAVIQQMLHAQNWARNIVRLAVNYYLPIVDTVHGQTGWYLFANPESGRPAIEFGKLRGHENPELFMKLPNSVAIGEGTMGPGPGITPGTGNQNPMEGDFDTDSIHYKIRTVKGGTLIDPIMAVYSNGSNA